MPIKTLRHYMKSSLPRKVGPKHCLPSKLCTFMKIKEQMKNVVILLLVFTSLNLSCQKIDINDFPTLKIARETSLYRNEVNWDEITKNYVELSNSEKGN